jgi:DNA excision repair protein ERCC-4
MEKITGLIVNHAHRVSETSAEAFILRLFRNENKEGFIRAFSDEPESFANGIWKLEKSMKTLYQRHVYLWPR